MSNQNRNVTGASKNPGYRSSLVKTEQAALPVNVSVSLEVSKPRTGQSRLGDAGHIYDFGPGPGSDRARGTEEPSSLSPDRLARENCGRPHHGGRLSRTCANAFRPITQHLCL